MTTNPPPIPLGTRNPELGTPPLSPQRKTLYLTLLLLCLLAWLPLTCSRMTRYRDDAQRAARDLAQVKSALADIHRWRASPDRAAATALDTQQLTQKLREAATAAGLSDAPEVDANEPKRLANSDFSETSVYLRLSPVTLKQLTTFLHTLSRIDPTSRPRAIELSAPPQAIPAPPPGEERWQAEVEVGWLIYSPQKR